MRGVESECGRFLYYDPVDHLRPWDLGVQGRWLLSSIGFVFPMRLESCGYAVMTRGQPPLS